MGFRKDTYAKVWEVAPVSSACTKVRLSISRKNSKTGEYEQDFGDYCLFCGTAVAAKALKLKKGDRIKLGDVETTNRFDKQAGVKYYDCKVFGFEVEGAAGGGNSRPATRRADPEPEEDPDDPDLPF